MGIQLRLTEEAREVGCRSTARRARQVSGGTGGHHAASFLAGAWTDVHHPVAAGHHPHVVLDDDDGVSPVDQPLKLRHQLLDVRRVEPRGGFVQDVQAVAVLGTLQLGGQLDALGFTARELDGRLAEAQIAEADLAHDLEGPAEGA